MKIANVISLSIAVFISVVSYTTNAQGAGDPRLDVLPTSPFGTMLNGTFSESDTYFESGSVWALTWQESYVFQHRLTHNNPDSTKDWDIRIGKGGQIYSFKAFGKEVIPPQRRTSNQGPTGHEKEWAPWIDEVFQAVAVNTDLNNVGGHKYFMHGSGVYLRDSTMTEPFYNPKLLEGMTTEDNTYSTVHWMNQAHTPTPHRSHVINYYKYRDVGDGILEVTAGLYNFANNDLNYFNFPWGGVRASNFGKYLYELNGSTVSQTTGTWGITNIDYPELSGWVQFTDRLSADGDTIGLVFGEDKTPLPSYQEGNSIMRVGFAEGQLPGANVNKSEEDWRNYQAFSGVRKFTVPPGTGIWSRFYYVTGKRTDVNNIISSQNLVAKTDYGLMDFTTHNADLVSWYGNVDGSVLSQKSSNGSFLFKLFAQPATGSVPVFRLKSPTGDRFISSDPYALTSTTTENGEEIYRSYDGSTEDWVILGYAMPSDDNSSAPSDHSFTNLSNRLSASAFVAKGMNVRVLTSGADPVIPVDYAIVEVAAHGTNLRMVGTSLTMDSSSGSAAQWFFEPQTDGSYKIISNWNGKRLSAASNTSVAVVNNTGSSTPDTDLWILEPIPNDASRFSIVNKSNNRRLIGYPDSSGGSVRLASPSSTGTWTRWKLTGAI